MHACRGVRAHTYARLPWTYLIRYASAHARDQDDAPAVSEAGHLATCRLRSKQHTVHVHVHHLQDTSVKPARITVEKVRNHLGTPFKTEHASRM